MAKKLKTLFLLSCFCAMGAFINSCAPKPATGIDREMFVMAKDTPGFVWFMHSDTLLHRSDASTHPKPWLRTRFNSIAASQLDSSGRIKEGITFPEGSLIVKEMYDKEKKLAIYSMLFKKTDSEFADKKGWVWSGVLADGNVGEAASNKGVTCISCHAQSGNIDFMLMNLFYH